jgi:hypothetical protein
MLQTDSRIIYLPVLVFLYSVINAIFCRKLWHSRYLFHIASRRPKVVILISSSLNLWLIMHIVVRLTAPANYDGVFIIAFMFGNICAIAFEIRAGLLLFRFELTALVYNAYQGLVNLQQAKKTAQSSINNNNNNNIQCSESSTSNNGGVEASSSSSIRRSNLFTLSKDCSSIEPLEKTELLSTLPEDSSVLLNLLHNESDLRKLNEQCARFSGMESNSPSVIKFVLKYRAHINFDNWRKPLLIAVILSVIILPFALFDRLLDVSEFTAYERSWYNALYYVNVASCLVHGGFCVFIKILMRPHRQDNVGKRMELRWASNIAGLFVLAQVVSWGISIEAFPLNTFLLLLTNIFLLSASVVYPLHTATKLQKAITQLSPYISTYNRDFTSKSHYLNPSLEKYSPGSSKVLPLPLPLEGGQVKDPMANSINSNNSANNAAQPTLIIPNLKQFLGHYDCFHAFFLYIAADFHPCTLLFWQSIQSYKISFQSNTAIRDQMKNLHLDRLKKKCTRNIPESKQIFQKHTQLLANKAIDMYERFVKLDSIYAVRLSRDNSNRLLEKMRLVQDIVGAQRTINLCELQRSSISSTLHKPELPFRHHSFLQSLQLIHPLFNSSYTREQSHSKAERSSMQVMVQVAEIYDEVEGELYNRMQAEVYPRFIMSPLFQQLRIKTNNFQTFQLHKSKIHRSPASMKLSTEPNPATQCLPQKSYLRLPVRGKLKRSRSVEIAEDVQQRFEENAAAQLSLPLPGVTLTVHNEFLLDEPAKLAYTRSAPEEFCTTERGSRARERIQPTSLNGFDSRNGQFKVTITPDHSNEGQNHSHCIEIPTHQQAQQERLDSLPVQKNFAMKLSVPRTVSSASLAAGRVLAKRLAERETGYFSSAGRLSSRAAAAIAAVDSY